MPEDNDGIHGEIHDDPMQYYEITAKSGARLLVRTDIPEHAIIYEIGCLFVTTPFKSDGLERVDPMEIDNLDEVCSLYSSKYTF